MMIGASHSFLRKRRKVQSSLTNSILLAFIRIDFCQKNCCSMRMAYALADHVFFISTNQMQPRCQSCVEFKGEFRGWHPFLLILNHLQAVAKSKCGKLLFSIIATTWQGPILCGWPRPHVTAPKTPPIKNNIFNSFKLKPKIFIINYQT